MNGRPPNPDQNICRVTLDLPWEIAEVLAEHGPQLIAVIQEAVGQRSKETERCAQVAEKVSETAEANKARWAALADICHREIDRRSNGPGQKDSILKALASELGHDFQFLKSVCRIYGTKIKKNLKADRDASVIELYFDGLSNSQIAEKLAIAPGSVSRILSGQKKKIAEIRAQRPPPGRSGPVNGGVS
ncbi:MAG: hypothetical protein RIC29_15835 [Rhodospirillaceae bacterium]